MRPDAMAVEVQLTALTRYFTTRCLQTVTSLELPIEDIQKMKQEFPKIASILYRDAVKDMRRISILRDRIVDHMPNYQLIETNKTPEKMDEKYKVSNEEPKSSERCSRSNKCSVAEIELEEDLGI